MYVSVGNVHSYGFGIRLRIYIVIEVCGFPTLLVVNNLWYNILQMVIAHTQKVHIPYIFIVFCNKIKVFFLKKRF